MNSRDPARCWRAWALSQAFQGGVALMIAGLAAVAPAQELKPVANPMVLTNAQQVVALGLEGARPGNVPVRLHATVTYRSNSNDKWVFVQDQTSGMLVETEHLAFEIEPGQIVDVEGVAEAGVLEGFVHASKFELVGSGPLPTPKVVLAPDLMQASDFGNWCSLDATVLDVAITKDRLVLLCAEGETHFQAWITQRKPMELPLELLDARVRLLGIPWVILDYEVQPIGFKFHLSSTNFVSVLRPGSADVFHGGLNRISDLKSLPPGQNTRRKVSGVVTLVCSDRWLAMQDDSGALVANIFKPILRDDDPKGIFITRNLTGLKPGDRIELAGSRAGTKTLAPELADAEFRVTGHAAPPTPRKVTTAEFISGAHDAELVSLNARVLETESRLKLHKLNVEKHNSLDLYEHHVWLQADEMIFDAVLESKSPTPPPAAKGDYVSVTGVCRFDPGQFRHSTKVHAYLRGPGDIIPTEAPPWWNTREAGRILVVGAVLALAALAWITLLRRRVAQRTAQLSAEIIERQKAEATLTRFKALADATSDLVALANLDGTATYFNAAWRRLLGLTPDFAASNLKVSDAYPAWVCRIFEDEAFAAAAQNGSWSGEVAVLDQDGREIPVSFVGLILRSPGGKPEYMGCVARDISERRRIEEQLRRALDQEKELSRLKTNFISMVSHEIRTPLANILSSSEILERYEGRLTALEKQEQLTSIKDAVDRMTDLLEDVLLFSRAEAGRIAFHPEPLELQVFCRQVAGEVAAATRGRNPIHVQAIGFAEPVLADKSLLQHILTNLLGNAIKYSEAGLPVTLDVSREGETTVFRVQDMGIGISEADCKRLFVPFFRAQNAVERPGTGLGLVIVRQCTERHGGQIHIESKENAGTTVTLRLPLPVAAAPAVPAIPVPQLS